jgi:hypothetical protein
MPKKTFLLYKSLSQILRLGDVVNLKYENDF